MQHSTIARSLLTALVVASSVLFAACGGSQEDQVTVADKKEVQGKAVTELFRVDNKTGTTALKQDMSARKQYTHETVITPNPGVKMNNQQVRQEIFKLYNISDDKQSEDQVCVIPVDVPAGQIYLYDVEWREVWREGTVELGQPDDKPEGTYRFKQGPLCQVVGVHPE